ncbi:hypothetical protein A6R68_22348 [Neotoma lepida]|uniref:TAFII55 protein conserved region domain-containing protein n=1 Tax=Neotoma lepida TaxID=56216 RepID=A0A1A6HZL6_NEOLE|nr:hypothetical protein A6R68_22348 [Neotoma lepida]
MLRVLSLRRGTPLQQPFQHQKKWAPKSPKLLSALVLKALWPPLTAEVFEGQQFLAVLEAEKVVDVREAQEVVDVREAQRFLEVLKAQRFPAVPRAQRFRAEQAYAVRKIIHSRSSAMKDKLKIDFSSDGHNAVVKVEDVSLSAKLMLVCRADSEPRHFPEEPVASTDPHVTARGERTQKKKYNWKHGITPPLKNVRKKRFRKTTKELPDTKQMEEISFSEYIQSPSVEKEVKRLLCSDAEAVSIRWEVIADDDTKEVESQGCISGISEIPEMSGPSSSEYDILREMFGDSGSNSNDVEDKADTIEVQDDDDEDDSDDDDEDEEDEEDEEEKEIDNSEADLERELHDMFIQPSFNERDKDYDYSSIRIQKLIYYKEKKLQQIYKKAQRQKDLLRNVENLTLKIYHLQEQLKCFLKDSLCPPPEAGAALILHLQPHLQEQLPQALQLRL